MARLFSTTTGRASTASVPTNVTDNFTMAIWVNYVSIDATTDDVIFANGNLASTGWALYYDDATASVRANMNGGGNAGGGAFSTTGAWVHFALRRLSGTGQVYKDGVAFGASFANIGNAPITFAEIGSTSGSFTMAKMAAEAAIWTRPLDLGEIAALAKGYSPKFFRRGCVFHAPLMGNTSPEPDLVGNRSMTLVGATKAAHPRIILPSGPKISAFTAAVVVPPVVVDETPVLQPQPAGGGRYAPPSYRKGYRRRIVFLEEELLEKHEQLRKLEQKQEVQETKVEDDGGKAAIEALSRTSEQIETIRLAIAELETEIAQETELRRDDEDAMTVILKALH